MQRLSNLIRLAASRLLASVIFVGRIGLVLLFVLPNAISKLRWRLWPAPPRPPRGARRPRVLLVGGTINHTTQVHQIAAALPEFDHAYTWYYCDGVLDVLRRARTLESTALGFKLRARCLAYLQANALPIDLGGKRGDYDLIVTCSDLAMPANMRGRAVVLVQEGMTHPEDLVFRLVRRFRLPPWLTTTSSATGLSHAYDKFCVASDGYRDLFVNKGVAADKIVVTGIPNFDNCARFLRNDFPHRGYVLVCSSDIRETARFEDRPKFIREVLAIAAGRQVIWKLHPNEDVKRARAEFARLAPAALVFDRGNAEEMIANCDVLITQFSSTAYVGLALGKEVHSYFDVEELRRLCPVQNGSTSARRIANVCRELLGLPVQPEASVEAASTGLSSVI